MSKNDLSFDLSIDPNPRFVSVVRRFIESAFDKVIDDPEAVFRVAMTAHELMENAAKYSFGSKATLKASFKADGAGGAYVTLCLVNATTPAHIERLKERIAAMNGEDPFVHYQKLMRENSRKVDESGLGLARICAEAEMSLGLEVSGETVAIVASARIEGGKKS